MNVPPFSTVPDAVEALRAGRPVLVLDDQDRENAGDVVLAASTASPEWVAWAVRHTSGLLCAAMPDGIADRLELPPMVARNQDPRGTAYTVSVDARLGVGWGISAADRARTARVLADPTTGPGDLVRPGHLLALRVRPGGVRERGGYPEAAVDLCTTAGLPPVGLIAELVLDDGRMMSRDDVLSLGGRQHLPVLTIADLAAYLGRVDETTATPPLSLPLAVPRVTRAATARLPTRHGLLQVTGYRDGRTGAEHLALTRVWPAGTAPLVRVHSECLTGDSLGSLRCDCGPQLDAALERIGGQGGALVYLGGHEGRGIGLLAKLQAYAFQDQGLDTVEANLVQDLPVDAREYGAAAAILADLGITSVRLLTNNPDKVNGLEAHGISVSTQVPLLVKVSPHNSRYLQTKRDRLGHRLTPAVEGTP